MSQGHQPISAGVGAQDQASPLRVPSHSLPAGTSRLSWGHPDAQPCYPAGARWDTQTGVIAEARLKELTPAMPVIFIKAIPVCPQKKFLISGVTIFTHSFTCRLGCSNVAEDTTPDLR